jgi:hypothetical protein
MFIADFWKKADQMGGRRTFSLLFYSLCVKKGLKKGVRGGKIGPDGGEIGEIASFTARICLIYP